MADCDLVVDYAYGLGRQNRCRLLCEVVARRTSWAVVEDACRVQLSIDIPRS